VEGAAIGLTPRSKRVIELAIDEAKLLGHNYVGTEHLLLGLLHEGNGIGCGILTAMGADLKQTRQAVIQVLSERREKSNPDHFARFTERARTVLTHSQEEARSLQHHFIGTEHLLLALLLVKGIATQALTNLNIQYEAVREGILDAVGEGAKVAKGEIEPTKRVQKVVEMSAEEAKRQNVDYVGTEHLLLALIREGEGLACQVIKKLGVRLEDVQAEVLRLINDGEQKVELLPIPEEAAALVAEGASNLSCPRCGAHSPTYFHYCFHCGAKLEA
jgi:ATP-dependent Clp protease ATP-binding subunit ClpA